MKFVQKTDIACVLQGECKVHIQKSGSHDVNILLDLRNYYTIDMDRGEHSQSHRIMAGPYVTFKGGSCI